MERKRYIDRKRGSENILDLQGYDKMRKQQAALLAAHMILEEVPFAAIRFLTKVYELFLEHGQTSAKSMAEAYGCSGQAAAKYINMLVNKGYLERVHYRAWRVNHRYFAYLGKVAA